jgi:hypothetical protein
MAKTRAEAIIRDAVAPVSSAFAPTVVFMFPMLGAMALPNLSRFRAPVCGPVGLTPLLAPMRLRGMLPVLPAVLGTRLPMLPLIVPLVLPLVLPLVVPLVLPLVVPLVVSPFMVVAPVLVRVLLRASVFLSVLVAVLSARGSRGAKSQNQCGCTEDRYDFHLSSVDYF